MAEDSVERGGSLSGSFVSAGEEGFYFALQANHAGASLVCYSAPVDYDCFYRDFRESGKNIHGRTTSNLVLYVRSAGVGIFCTMHGWYIDYFCK